MGSNRAGCSGGVPAGVDTFVNIPLKAIPIRDGTGRMYQNMASTGALLPVVCPVNFHSPSVSMGGAFSHPAATVGEGTVQRNDRMDRPCPLTTNENRSREPIIFDAVDLVNQVGIRDSGPICSGSGNRNLVSIDEEVLICRDRKGKAIAVEKARGEKRRSLDAIYSRTPDASLSEAAEVIVYLGKKSRKALQHKFVLCPKKKVMNRVPGFCPLSYHYEYDMPSKECADASYEKMIFCSSKEIIRLWVVHTEPSLLKMTECKVLDSFHRNSLMKGKGFESVRRMMRSVEKSWYSRGERSRFRHIMPLAFTRAALDSSVFELTEEIKDMFTGHGIDYDIETCHMIWAPYADDEGVTVLYGFDMNLNILHVMDPKRMCAGRQVLESVHSAFCSKLLDAFCACVEGFFDGWGMDKTDWTFLYHEYKNGPCSDEDTAFYSIHNMMYFDGIAVTEHATKEGLVDLRKKLMVMVVNMDGNLGHAPNGVKIKVG